MRPIAASVRVVGVAWILTLATGCERSPSIDETKLVDLSHPYGEETVYWPTASRFRLERVAYGRNERGEWYAANDFGTSEHGGTHLDAPIHFAEGKRGTAEIPLSQLVGPARVIDIREACRVDVDYRLTPQDVEAHEAKHGEIPPGAIVLIHTGHSRFYPDPKRYLGDDRKGATDRLHFPGIGVEAARLLVERKVDLVGIDTASLDHGPSTDFATHRILNEANVPGLENVARLELLPATGATVFALPMKIEGGTGGPCRIVALLP